MKHNENLTLHQKSVRAFIFHVLLQFQLLITSYTSHINYLEMYLLIILSTVGCASVSIQWIVLTQLIIYYNLGQNKKEQLTPFPPQSNDEGARRPKPAILASLKWGGGEVEMFHSFCPRLYSGCECHETMGVGN